MPHFRIFRTFIHHDTTEGGHAHITFSTIRRVGTLDEAVNHCEDPETSKKTATGDRARRLNKKYLDWWDGWTRED